MNIAIIPARGGSKRIPRKNIRQFCGKPMIAWSIEAARASGLFDHVIVSTDDEEIASVATSHGAETPFVRPPELSTDHAGTTEVMAHATRWACDQGWDVRAACCIYATAPFVQIADLQLGWEQLRTEKWLYVFAATDFAAPIFRSFSLLDTGGVEMFFPEFFAARSQDLQVAFHDAAQFYWGTPRAWLDHKRVFDSASTVVRIPRWRVQDIDTEEDWLRAEVMAAHLLRRGERAESRQ